MTKEGNRMSALHHQIAHISILEVIQSHIDSTQDCRVVLKLDRFSHLSSRSFRLGSQIGLEDLSLVL